MIQRFKFIFCIVLAFTIVAVGCISSEAGEKEKVPEHNEVIPETDSLAANIISSPLRNRVELELNAPVSEVWSLVGDPGNMPDYSAGLEKVETKTDQSGKCLEFTCYFKPQGKDMPGLTHTAKIKLYEKNKSWISLDAEPNEFGLTKSYSQIVVESTSGGTRLIWSQYYNAKDLEANKTGFEMALNDISKNLVKRFGGKIIENFTEGKSK